MSFRSKLGCACLLVFLAVSEHSLPAWAEPGLSYSGRLVTADGKPVQGPADLVLRFFDQDSGGTPLIGERMLSAVPLDDGMFEVELNLSQSDLNTVLGNGSTNVYIEISHGPTTYPRQKFAAVPYALRVPIDRTSIIQDDQGRLAVGAIPASKILGLATATAGVLGGVSFDQANPAPGKVIKWNGSKYYLDLDNTGGAGGAISATTITTSERAAITIAPYGSGGGETAELRFGELAANGSNYIAFKAPDTLVSNLVWTLPARDGASGQMLTTNGSGELTWSAISSANIVDTSITDAKLQTLSTPGKVSGSAITAGTLGGSSAFNGAGGIATLGPIAAAGNITLKGRESEPSELRFADSDSSHYLSFKAPATVSNNRTWILPLADGAPGAALTTDGGGNLSWVTPDIASGASIVTSKLSGPLTAIANHGLGILSLQNAVSSSQIDDFTIVDADIASTAGIAGSKISFADDAISGDKIQGGVISDFASIGIDDNAGSLAMTIDSAGKIGIGTTAPTADFEVYKPGPTNEMATLKINAASSWNYLGPQLILQDGKQHVARRGAAIDFYSTNSIAGIGAWSVGRPYNSDNFAIGFVSGGASALDTLSYATNAKLVMTTEGKVGIGTTTPAQALDVSGSIKTSGSFIEKSVTFTPTTVGWYRIVNAAMHSGGTIRLTGFYDNAGTDVEFEYYVMGHGQQGSIQQTKHGFYNNGVVSQVRISNNGSGLAYLDIYVYRDTVPAPITVYAYGPNQASLVAAPVVGAVAGSFNVATLTLANGFHTTAGITAGGNVGIGTTAPNLELVVRGRTLFDNNSGDGYPRALGTTIATAPGANFTPGTDPQDSLRTLTLATTGGGSRPVILTFRNLNNSGAFWDIIADGNTNKLYLQAINKSPAMSIQTDGNVGIGTTTPTSTLTVAGAARNAAAILNNTTTIDFARSNLQYTNASCGSFNLHHLQDGGSYSFVVKGTTSASCTFYAYSDAGTTALTMHLPIDHAATTSGTHTIYVFLVVGSDVYASWNPGL